MAQKCDNFIYQYLNDVGVSVAVWAGEDGINGRGNAEQLGDILSTPHWGTDGVNGPE